MKLSDLKPLLLKMYEKNGELSAKLDKFRKQEHVPPVFDSSELDSYTVDQFMEAMRLATVTYEDLKEAIYVAVRDNITFEQEKTIRAYANFMEIDFSENADGR